MDFSSSLFRHSVHRRIENESEERRRDARRGLRRSGRQRQRVEQLEREVVELAAVLQVVLKRLHEQGLLEEQELAELVSTAVVELAREQGVRLEPRRKRRR